MKKIEIEQDELSLLIEAALKDEDFILHQRVMRGASIANVIVKHIANEKAETKKTPFPEK